MPSMLAISLMTGICGICPVARILVVCTMARACYRSVYKGYGSARDASKDEKSPPSPRRWMKKTKEDCFHGKYPTTRSLTRHEQPFPGTPLLTDQSKLLQLRGLKKPGLGSWSRESRQGLITPPKLRFSCDRAVTRAAAERQDRREKPQTIQENDLIPVAR